MAITTTDIRNLSAVRLFSRKDDAIEKETDWDKYAEDPIANEGEIKIVAGKQATVFIFNFDWDAKTEAKLQDKAHGGFDEDKNSKTNIGSYAYNVVRLALKGIENPPGVKDVIVYKQDSGKYASKETMDKLYRAGLIGELFSYWLLLKAEGKDEEAEIKN